MVVGRAFVCWEMVPRKFKLNTLQERETKEKKEEMVL